MPFLPTVLTTLSPRGAGVLARDAPRHFPKGGFLPTAKGGLMGESEERGGSQGGFNVGESEERGGQKPMSKSKFL